MGNSRFVSLTKLSSSRILQSFQHKVRQRQTYVYYVAYSAGLDILKVTLLSEWGSESASHWVSERGKGWLIDMLRITHFEKSDKTFFLFISEFIIRFSCLPLFWKTIIKFSKNVSKPVITCSVFILQTPFFWDGEHLFYTYRVFIKYFVFSKNFREFNTSPSPTLGGYWLHKKMASQ